VDGATWDSMTASQFAQCQVIIIGDPTCDYSGDNFQAAVNNESTWEPVVMSSGGNKVLIGTDPVFHFDPPLIPSDVLIGHGIAYAGAKAGATGAYVDLSCAYDNTSPKTPVPLLDGLSTHGAGQFTVVGEGFYDACSTNVNIVAQTGPTAGLTDADLSDWGCSVHEAFDKYPSDYTPLALAPSVDASGNPQFPSTYCADDVETGAQACGSPYIMVSGAGVVVRSQVALTPKAQTLVTGTSASLVANISSGPGNPVTTGSVVFSVDSGPEAGTTSTGTPDESGNVTFGYKNNGTAGTDSISATYTEPATGISLKDIATVTWSTSPTTLTTVLRAGESSGVQLDTLVGTPVTDSATLDGNSAATATGTVTYNVYSDSACTQLTSAGTAQKITTPGTLPPSAPVTLRTPGTYYWKAAYSGDAANKASVSTCGSSGEVETVTATPPATSLATSLSGAGHSGATLTVPSGQPAHDVATLSGKNAAKATGTVTFTVYSDSKCTKRVASLSTTTITNGQARSGDKGLAAGVYYWTASYSGDAANRASASSCGSEVLTVKAAAGKPGAVPVIDTVTITSARTSASAKVRTTVAGDLVVAFVAANGPASSHQKSTMSGGGMTWYLISRQNAPGNDSEVWAALPSGKLSSAVITAKASISGFDEILMVVAFKNATGIGPEAFAHATSGAPKASLKTTAANSWVFGLGSDWSKFASRTPGRGQLIFAQGGPPFKATAWIQAPVDVTPKAGTTVTINDTAPTGDPYNLLLVAIQ
jgi:hypothetical protein